MTRTAIFTLALSFMLASLQLPAEEMVPAAPAGDQFVPAQSADFAPAAPDTTNPSIAASPAASPEAQPQDAANQPEATPKKKQSKTSKKKKAAKRADESSDIPIQQTVQPEGTASTNMPDTAVAAPAPTNETSPDNNAAAPAKEKKHPHATEREGQTDYRYCLDLPTNAEIAACRYKHK